MKQQGPVADMIHSGHTALPDIGMKTAGDPRKTAMRPGDSRQEMPKRKNYFYSSVFFALISASLAVYHYSQSAGNSPLAPRFSAVWIICSLICIGFLSQAYSMRLKKG